MADNGGRIIADVLEAEGVAKVFGIPDGTYLGLLNALVAGSIEVVTPRHETTAIHMAAAYARLRGDLGVAIASNGPSVANALPGIAVENAEGELATAARPEAHPIWAGAARLPAVSARPRQSTVEGGLRLHPGEDLTGSI